MRAAVEHPSALNRSLQSRITSYISGGLRSSEEREEGELDKPENGPQWRTHRAARHRTAVAKNWAGRAVRSAMRRSLYRSWASTSTAAVNRSRERERDDGALVAERLRPPRRSRRRAARRGGRPAGAHWRRRHHLHLRRRDKRPRRAARRAGPRGAARRKRHHKPSRRCRSARARSALV